LNKKETKMKGSLIKALTVIAIAALFVAGCASGPLSTRESSALVGTGLGAAAGGIIGSATGHAAAGALIGGGLGLLGGALIGDQLQAQQQESWRQEDEIRRQQYELDRQRWELEQMRRERGEY
jgi:uncharacterized membrane protein